MSNRTALTAARGVFAPTMPFAIQTHEVTWEEYERYDALALVGFRRARSVED